MRPIKFRAKTLDGDWTYFTLEDLLRGEFDENIDFETICQYIGLKDKNEKEIYRGDIIRLKNKDDEEKKADHMQGVGEVGWEKNSGGFGWGKYFVGIFDWDGTESIEIIGDKWENKELLTNK